MPSSGYQPERGHPCPSPPPQPERGHPCPPPPPQPERGHPCPFFSPPQPKYETDVVAPATQPYAPRRPQFGSVGLRASLLLVASLILISCGKPPSSTSTATADRPAKRIISLSPSITETVYAVGAGDKLCGATDYCNYPEAARQLPRVGGYFNPAYERIIGLQPDLILVLPEHLQGGSELESLGVPLAAVGNQRVADVLAGIIRVGEICDRQDAASALHADLLARLAKIREAHAHRQPPRTLVCISRGSGRGAISEVYVAGSGSIHDEWLGLAGGTNVVTTADYPMLSTETILRLDPDLIVELSASTLSDEDRQTRIADWQSLDRLQAVKAGRVRVLDGDHMMIPGPRFLQAVEALATAVGNAAHD